MNARLLTIVFMSCSLLIAKTVAQPKLHTLQANKAQDATSAQVLAGVQTQLAFVNSLAEGKSTHVLIEQLKLDEVTVQTMARLQKTKRDFGVVLSEVAPANITGGQNVMPLQNLQSVHQSTGLGIQEISIKGSYESLEDFQQFVTTQVVEPGGSVSALKMRGNLFEMFVQVFGQRGA